MVLKRRFFCVVILIFALCLTGANAADAAEENLNCTETGAEDYRPDYVRLHVIAENDSEAAQALKLKVRDACLEAARPLLADSPDVDAAWATLNAHLEEMERAVRDAARENGFEGDVTAQTGVYTFPERVYGDAVVPAGRYRALRVVIGAGEGHNWWCVLYPSLCYPEDWKEGEPIKFYSSILRWIRSWFGGSDT